MAIGLFADRFAQWPKGEVVALTDQAVDHLVTIGWKHETEADHCGDDQPGECNLGGASHVALSETSRLEDA